MTETTFIVSASCSEGAFKNVLEKTVREDIMEPHILRVEGRTEDGAYKVAVEY
jgi:hypothetical protein